MNTPAAALLAMVAVLAFATPPGLTAARIDAGPSTYRSLLRKLQPGDTLHLARGTYPVLQIAELNGREDAWITITGPDSGAPAVVVGVPGQNAVDISNSSYVAIRNLRIDSRGIPGSFGVAAHGREESLTHNIRIENNVFVGQHGSQGTDAISTKTPTWGWVIRNNQIIGAGTGMYLGDSDGNQPFVAGLIENNLIKDTIGYNLQIKFQKYLPAVEGLPAGPTSTIIRNNVFIKGYHPAVEFDRPNVLLGGFPYSGPGSHNLYEVYGNLFFNNPREALFQASGRVTLHDNVFVGGPATYPAIVFRDHDQPLKIAYVYNNTVYTSGKGIYFGSRARIDDAVVANLVFGLPAIDGQIMRKLGNITDLDGNADKYVNSPSSDLGSMDFYPLPGRCQGPAAELTMFHTDTDYALDFNGTPKTRTAGAAVFRGAYAGEGKNPGWKLEAAIRHVPNRAISAPVLAWISPASTQAGASKAVKLTGMNFTPEVQLAVSGDDVKVGNIKIESATELTATLTVSAAAAAGPRDVVVSTAAGSSDPLRFRVTRGGGASQRRRPR